MNRAIGTSLCFAVLGLTAASRSFAQDETPHARTATNRSIVIRKAGSSYLGIGVAEIDSERAKALNLKEVHGVEVKSVDRDSPAAKAGLKDSDVVLEYNGQRIEGTEQFVRLVRETPIDRQVKLLVWRNAGTQTLTATIGRRLAQYAFRAGDGDDGDLTVEGRDLTVEVPPMPPMPPMPEMPPMPDMAPMADMAPLADVLRAHGSMRSGMLGIDCEALGSQLAGFFGVKEGVLVRSVAKDSAAEKAGMRAGDVIVKVDGEAVTQVHEIGSLLRAARSQRTFPVVVVRDKKEVTLNVTL
jgi:serine protease Do